MKYLLTLLCFIIGINAHSQHYKKSEPFVSTYSIVARDSVTGDIGVAVQSHWFNVGALVIYAEPGVGVVATQSLVQPSYGPMGLALMKEGESPELALQTLIEKDSGKMYRQVAMLNTKGQIAAHTGSSCIGEAGHKTGKNYSVQANMMLKNTVWGAMSKAFETTQGTLAERILASLKAAQNDGGDIRGKQSAAILIVKGKDLSGNSWEDTLMNLRVEDHVDPISELERLINVHKAYDFMNQGDVAMENGDSKKAESFYLTAQKMFPDNIEMQFWYAINLLNNKDFETAEPILKSIFKKNENWKILVPRLIKSNLLALNEKELEMVMAY